MKIKLILGTALSIAMLVSGCGGGGGSSSGGGDGGGSVTESTTISGTVSLSGSATANKPTAKMSEMLKVAQGKPGTYVYRTTNKSQSSDYKLPSAAAEDVVTSAFVFLYDSDHPEWLAPVASSETDSLGNYTLSVLANAAENDNAYTDGAAIPVGNYTLLAFKPGGFDPILGVTTEAVVAVQTVVNEFDGDIAGADLTAQPSSVAPTVETMFGQGKNTDGTQTWGSDSLELAPNAAIQVTFSMAMSRGSIENGIGISPTVAGHWSVSADWLSATFYLDDGAALQANQAYTVTVNGADTSSTPVTNVYGNNLAETATGSFFIPAQAVADTTAPVVAMLTPNANTTTGVKISDPIRVSSNEILDINNLLLASTPSLGVKPGVMFVGEKENLFVYEFILAEPLKLDTSYSVTISGGTDMAGNAMASLSHTFATEATTEGVDSNATADVQTAQAEVKDAFGKWVRALDDGNLTQVQNLMSGDFIMQYDTTAEGIDEADINRDGVWSLQEFSDMLLEAFQYWEYCGTTITGSIVTDENGNAINVDTTALTADFGFNLTGTSTITSRECTEATPEDSLYASLEKINGVWTIVKASEGIDTRSTDTGGTAAGVGVVTLGAPARIAVLDTNTGEQATDADGNLIYENVEPTLLIDDQNTVLFEWEVKDQAVSGVDPESISAFVMIFVNARDPESGFAVALPPTFNSMNIPSDIDQMEADGTIAEVSEEFGFHEPFEPRSGSVLYWQIAALGSNTVRDINEGRDTDLLRDVIAISQLAKFTIEGVYKELDVTVAVDVQGTETELTFNEFIDGFDAGSAGQATITVRTPDLNATQGQVFVGGHTFQDYPLTFGTTPVDVNGTQHLEGSVVVDLNEGWNWVDINDANMSGGTGEGGPDMSLSEHFQITTTGGIAPVIAITSVTDQANAALTDDGWDFYVATGATSVHIEGTVDASFNINELYVNLWNDKLHANAHRQIDLSGCSTDPCTFSVDVDIYLGENWINISGGNFDPNSTGAGLQYSAHFGVRTDTGSEWVAPITLDGVTGQDDQGVDVTIVKNEDWGDGSNWDASAATSNSVIISGNMRFASDTTDSTLTPRYDIGSDGGWQGGDLTVQADGSFSLTVELFNGWNYVNFNDVRGNWHGVNIFTEAGKVVVRPEILTVNGVTFAGGDVTTDQCSVTISATAMAGEVRAYWNGSVDGENGMREFFWEEQILESDGTNPFEVVVNLVSGAGADNWIDLNDANWNWMGFRAITTNANCTYTAPLMTVEEVADQGGTPLTATFSDQFGADYDVGTSASIGISGTSNQAGRTISVEVRACGGKDRYDVQAGTTDLGNGTYAWSVSGVLVYEGYNDMQVSDGKNWYRIGANSQNGVVPTPALEATVQGATQDTAEVGCGFSRWDAGSATSVTISGTTTAADGTGEYDVEGTHGQFDIVSGAFSFTVDLYDGFNFVNIYDSNWNFQNLEIQSSNGVMKPQFVTITSPAHGATVTNPTSITATIANNPDGSSDFRPKHVTVFVNDFNANQWTEYSSDPNAAEWGALSATLTDNQDGTYSVSLPVSHTFTTNPTEIRVWADGENGANGWINHEHVITVNDANGWTSYYKTGNASGQDTSAEINALKRIKAATSRR